MSVAAKINQQRERVITAWKTAFFVLAFITVGVVINNNDLRDAIRVWVAPDLSRSQLVESGQAQKAYVYNFANTVISGINRWKTDGETEYKSNIYKYSVYISSSFQNLLLTDYKRRLDTSGGRTNELKDRSREMSLLSAVDSTQYVRKISGDRFYVYLDVLDEERYKGELIKSGAYRYVFEVVYDSANPEKNDTGLKISRLVEAPKEISGN